MEEMNNITEMVNDTTMEVPTAGTETGGNGTSVVGTIAGVGTVILIWEGAKFVAKKARNGLKKVFKKKQKAEEIVEDFTEVEIVDQD